MDPAIILFGLGIGVLVGMTGMGGGSLMTPLLILIFGIQPTTAIGTDIFYSAITKTVGGWRHFRMKTVNMELVKWLALGSVPAAVFGVALVSVLENHVGEDRLDSLVYAVLGGTLLMVGIITLARALILRNLVEERDRFEVERRHKVAAVVIGATTGFVIGITSAGSGTVIAILLIAVYRLSPKKVVGTDVFHAAILLWAAGDRPLDRRQRRLRPRRQHPGRLGAGRGDRRRPLRQGPAGLHPHRPRPRPGRLRASSRSRRATRPSGRSPPASPRSASGLILAAPHWLNRRRDARTASKRPTSPPRGERLASWLTRRRCASPPRPTTPCGRQPSWPPPARGPVKGERLAEAQDIPLQFLEHILLELKHAADRPRPPRRKGGYWLARPADEMTIADIVRAVEGPIAARPVGARRSRSIPRSSAPAGGARGTAAGCPAPRQACPP